MPKRQLNEVRESNLDFIKIQRETKVVVSSKTTKFDDFGAPSTSFSTANTQEQVPRRFQKASEEEMEQTKEHVLAKRPMRKAPKNTTCSV
jgi:hypothetical protein